MVRIPYIKIPSVRVGSIVPTSNIGTGGATPVPPTPITYLTQWKIVGNSEVHGNEIWSCGEYNPTDGKYHILVQPLGGSIADIALTEPLRKVNDVVDTIEFPSDTEGKALVTRNLDIVAWTDVSISKNTSPIIYFAIYQSNIKAASNNIKSAVYPTYSYSTSVRNFNGFGISGYGSGTSWLRVVDEEHSDMSVSEFRALNSNNITIFELTTPTTELVDAPQIQEADSYTCVISPDGKAVSWSSFETE